MPTRLVSWELTLRQLHRNLATGSRVVLIDGRSGSGKTTLAAMLRDRARRAGEDVALLHLDQVYPGWNGLRAGAREVAENVVVPLASGRPGSCLEYDWATGRKTSLLVFAPDRPLIVEGVGALHPLSSSLASGRVWVTAAAWVRRRRALERDGDGYRPYWQVWARQEADYVRRSRPITRTDLILDTTEAGGDDD